MSQKGPRKGPVKIYFRNFSIYLVCTLSNTVSTSSILSNTSQIEICLLKTEHPKFSYICQDDNGAIRRKKLSSYQPGDTDCSTETVTIATVNFWEWYTAGNFQSYKMSADEKHMLVYKNYQKQWRHSYFADYYVYDLEMDTEIVTADIRHSLK